MGAVEVTGTLYESLKVGRKARRAYFVLIADRKLVKVGIPKDRILCVNGLRVPFTTRLLIVGKYGSSGLEGFKEGKGAWIRVELKPSKGVRKRITLSLPFTYNKRAKLTVEGEFELTSIQYPSWVKVGELFYLEE